MPSEPNPPSRTQRPGRPVSAIPPMRRGAAPTRPTAPPGPTAPHGPTAPIGPPSVVPQQRGPGRRRVDRARSAKVWWIVLPVALIVTLIGAFRFAGGQPDAAPAESAADVTAAGPSAPVETPAPTPSPTPPPLAALRFRAAPITVKTEGFFAWALLDRRTGEVWGSTSMTGVTWTASMIKSWLAADYLRRAQEANQTPSTARLRELEIMIRDSDNNAAEATYRRNGGNASIKRLISRCKLQDTKASTKGWSFTAISARDTVRMADCIGDGTAAGSRWTDWLLGMMRKVRGEGDFGIRKALPAAEAATVSIKNGWLFYDDDKNWHINCLALTETWAVAVLQRYPGHGKWNSDYARGRAVCRDLATNLLNPEYAPAG